MGLFSLVINALMLMLTSWLFPLFEVSGFGTALAGSLILTVANTLLTGLSTLDDDYSYFGRVIRWLSERRREDSGGGGGRGVVMLEIDGLGYELARTALAEGRMPNLARLLERGTHVLSPYDCGLPSQTSSCQAGIMFGVNDDIPAFRWYEKEQGRVVSSSAFDDAAMMNARYAGRGGLLRDGSGINNHATGDAHKTVLVMSAMGKESEGPRRRGERDFNLFFVNPYLYSRTLFLTLADAMLEVWEGLIQRVRNEEPRVNRLHKGYPLVRAATNVLLRNISTFLVVNDVVRGVPAIYTTYVGYDEIAHHSGPTSKDAMRSLGALDKQFKRILDAVGRHAARPYDIFVLADHGQSFGATFKQRYGQSLTEFMERELAGRASIVEVDATEHSQGQTAAFFHTVREMGTAGGDEGSAVGGSELPGAEPSGAISAIAEPPGLLRRAGEILERQGVLSEPKREIGEDIIVLASGNLANAYFRVREGKVTLPELEAAYPGFVDAVVRHPGVGFIVAYEETGDPVVLGKSGRRDLVHGQVHGEDPLSSYGNPERRAAQLAKIAGYKHAGDLIVNSTLYQDGRVAAFEELIGSHGGLGGAQTEPFVIHPADMPAPDTFDSCDMFAFLDSRRGLEEPSSQPAALREPSGQELMSEGLRRPRTWLRQIRDAFLLRQRVFTEVGNDPRAGGPALLVILCVALASAVAGAVIERDGESAAVNLVVSLGAWLLSFGVAVMVVQAALRVLRKRDTLGRVFRALSFAEGPELLVIFSPIPYVGWAVAAGAFVMSLVTGWKALRHGVGVGRVAALVVPLLALAISLGVLIFAGAAVQGVEVTIETIIDRFDGH